VYSRFMARSSATHAQIGMFEGESCKVDPQRIIGDDRVLDRSAEMGALPMCCDNEVVGGSRKSRAVIICVRTCCTRGSS
jgi:hypothetical protein